MQAKDLSKGMTVVTVRGEKVVRTSSAFKHSWRLAFTDGTLLICQPGIEFPVAETAAISQII